MKTFWNIFLAFACYFICRVVFILQNWQFMTPGLEELDFWKACLGALTFDISTICSTLGIYILAMLLPIPARNRDWYQKICKIYYMTVMTLAIAINLADSVYFKFSERRTTLASLVEFKDENLGRLLRITAIEFLHNWYLVLLAAALVAALALLYRKGGDIRPCGRRKADIARRCAAALLWVAMIPAIVIGIRGGLFKGKPLNIVHAMEYVGTSAHASAILNTTFAMVRNLSHKGYATVSYMPEEMVEEYYNPRHKACSGTWTGKDRPNVCLIIVESLSQEFIGAYNNFTCHTPFLDSLRSVSLYPVQAFANGNKSVDALPSILTSLPRVEEHLVNTTYVNHPKHSLIEELARKGYDSAFFHGGDPGSMGFNAYVSSCGTQKTYSNQEYFEDRRFGGRKDHDGTWGIWDNEFLQYSVTHITEDLREPFASVIFTLSSHHPFKLPERCRERFSLPGHPMLGCVQYTDNALRNFFRTASQQSWYQNTIFILTADHASPVSSHEEYSDDFGRYRIPIMIFDPSQTLPRGPVEISAQQSDIFPTLMGILGTDHDYIAFGKDFLAPEAEDIVYFYKETHLFKHGDAYMLFNGSEVTKRVGETDERDEMTLKALIQGYKIRVIHNKLKIN